MKKLADSHLDHSLDDKQIEHIFERFANRTAFFIETFELPEELGTVPCGLHGPLMDDPPVLDARLGMRGTRTYPSRLVQRPTRQTRKVTVIAGPHDGYDCVLYTAFGGPLTPKEPGETGARLVAFVMQQFDRTYIEETMLDRLTAIGDTLRKLDELREEHRKSVAFWNDHALSL